MSQALNEEKNKSELEQKEPEQAKNKPALKVFRPENPYVALGLAVNHLMTKPAFANLKFGAWARILVGQINRKHYWFAVDDKNQIQGFMGWAVTTKEHAEAWVEGRRGFSSQEGSEGDCLVFNAWAANSLAVNRFLLNEARKVMQGKEFVYFKRYYDDGSTRPSRVAVNEFVGRHIERKRAGEAGQPAP